jgi:hypothetical protein
MAIGGEYTDRILDHEVGRGATYSGPAVLIQQGRRVLLSRARVRNAGTWRAPVWVCWFQCQDEPWPEPGEAVLELPGRQPAPVIVGRTLLDIVKFPGGALLGVTGQLSFTEARP